METSQPEITGNKKAKNFMDHIRNDDFANMIREYRRENKDKRKKLFECCDSEGRKPLHIAAEYGLSEALSFLLSKRKKYNFDIDDLCNGDKTALYLACRRGYKYKKSSDEPKAFSYKCGTRGQTIKLLLDNKAKTNPEKDFGDLPKGSSKMTCLHWACMDPKDAPIVKQLLDKGADPLALNYENVTPLDIAGLYSQNEGGGTLNQLLTSVQEKINDDGIKEELEHPGLPSIPNVVEGEQVVAVYTKLSSYDTKNLQYLKALYWAAYAGNSYLVKMLIQRGMSPFTRHTKGGNAIIAAIRGWDPKLTYPLQMQILNGIFQAKYKAIDQDSNYDVVKQGIMDTDEEGNTILHIATLKNNKNAFSFLKELIDTMPTESNALQRMQNLKGLIPKNLMYKEESKKDKKNYSYAIVVSIKKDLGNLIKKELKEKFIVEDFPSIDIENYKFLGLAVSDSTYGAVAEELGIEVELKSHNVLLPFYNSEESHDKYYPLNRAQKHHIIEHIVETELDIKSFKKNETVIANFPLHSEKKSKALLLMSGMIISLNS